MNDKQSAIDALTEVLRENPDYTEAKMNLSEIYKSEGKIQDALKILEYHTDSSKLKFGDGNVYLLHYIINVIRASLFIR